MDRTDCELPALTDIEDLRKVELSSVVVSLLTPVLAAALYFYLAFHQQWFLAFLCVAYLSFCTYASTSHDLVHGAFRLPVRLNNFLLSAMELLCLRSGHAYRLSHLHHHKVFPAADDVEAQIACGSLVRLVCLSPFHQFRIWRWSLKNGRRSDRVWLIAEATISTLYIVFSLLSLRYTAVFFVYTVLVIGGSWVYPFATVYFPHDPKGTSVFFQTRLFRHRLFDLLSLGHLYHLEHHLYPSVPHQKWRQLARRLDPYFAEIGLKPFSFHWKWTSK